ncbi:MAG TPA: CBS domain-containing protein [Pirellulaceae bacterium]|nr:CBS domain-containing protein [Pirellulaceae bacterium]
MLTAKDIMNPKVITIGPHATVGDAINSLLERRISGLPVVNERGDLVGVITEFALLAAAYDGKVRNDPVSKHMTKQVLSVDENASLQSIADTFIIHRVRRVPVLRQNHLIGQISRRDLLRAVEAVNRHNQEAIAAAVAHH